jgi:UMP-CMP kinase
MLHLSAGELLRKELTQPSQTSKLIEQHMKNGTIVPVEITCGLLKQEMVVNKNKV